MTGRVLVLDNRDSFVFNLVDEFRSRGAAVRTLRSNLSLDALRASLEDMRPHLVVLSPGPGRPEDAGVMVAWLRTDPVVPVLGICLGHQALAVAAGGEVGRAPAPVHGRADRILVTADNGEPLLAPLAPSFEAARYHSLVVTKVPHDYRVIATTDDEHELVMAMTMTMQRRRRVGLQFHPESILTPAGRGILARFLDEAMEANDDP